VGKKQACFFGLKKRGGKGRSSFVTLTKGGGGRSAFYSHSVTAITARRGEKYPASSVPGEEGGKKGGISTIRKGLLPFLTLRKRKGKGRVGVY